MLVREGLQTAPTSPHTRPTVALPTARQLEESLERQPLIEQPDPGTLSRTSEPCVGADAELVDHLREQVPMKFENWPGRGWAHEVEAEPACDGDGGDARGAGFSQCVNSTEGSATRYPSVVDEQDMAALRQRSPRPEETGHDPLPNGLNTLNVSQDHLGFGTDRGHHASQRVWGDSASG